MAFLHPSPRDAVRAGHILAAWLAGGQEVQVALVQPPQHGKEPLTVIAR